MKWILLLLVFVACDQSAGYHPPMSHTLTPVSTFSTPLTVPDDGDACNAASVETPFQSLVNQTQVLFNGLLNLKVRPSLRSVNGTDIVIGAVPMIVGTEGGSWKALAYAGSTYTPAGLANNTWYYLYAKITAGSVVISHSTTAPDSYLRTMNGNTDYVFLGSFRTDGSGVIYPFFSRDGETMYAASVAILAFSSAPPTVATDVSLAGGVPPYSQKAYLNLIGHPDTGVAEGMNVKTKGVTAAGISPVALSFTVNDKNDAGANLTWIQTDTSQTIQYYFDVGGGASRFALHVRGYSE